MKSYIITSGLLKLQIQYKNKRLQENDVCVTTYCVCVCV
uniref:Uncharacterized protein n=1 Tax=Anguilla anguilla TaxID=7936 RepID=A0A0E9TRZ4_ANGAN